MNSQGNKLSGLLKRMHQDEGGAQMLEWILILGAVVVPLLGALIWFRKDIGSWVSGQYEEVKNDPNTTYNSTTTP